MLARRRWLVAGALVGVALLLAAARWGMVANGPSWCLPPLFEDGQRLHSVPSPTAFWLWPLLRQHQLCHAARARPADLRAILIGNSAVLGYPLPFDETFGARLNESLAEDGVRGRVFNLGFLYPYELRDALVLHAALEYRPDLIIYPLTLADFPHQAPFPLPEMHAFFESNDMALHELARDGLPGLDEPLRLYDSAATAGTRTRAYLARLQGIGALARAAAHAHAEVLARWVDPLPTPRLPEPRRSRSKYDCRQTLVQGARRYRNWQDWNILAYLQQVRDTDGIPVLIVNLPVTHEPIGKCYNVRYATAAVERFNQWLRAECEARGFAYVDLHDLLPPDEFVDPLHPSAEGHRRVAERLAPEVETLLRARAAARGAAAS